MRAVEEGTDRGLVAAMASMVGRSKVEGAIGRGRERERNGGVCNDGSLGLVECRGEGK